jgi:hypothetical protein
MPAESGSPLGAKPAKFGANKESMEYLVESRLMNARIDAKLDEITSLESTSPEPPKRSLFTRSSSSPRHAVVPL